jgi:hypothetical protein
MITDKQIVFAVSLITHSEKRNAHLYSTRFISRKFTEYFLATQNAC